MRNDPLTEIVTSLDLAGAIFMRADLTAPWAIDSDVSEEACKPHMQVPRTLMAFHVVLEGEALVSLDRGPGRKLHYRAKAGDVVFSSTNAVKVLASSMSERPVPVCDLMLPPSKGGLLRIEKKGDGEVTRMLGGFMASYTVQSALLDMLPEVLVTSVESMETRKWIETSLAMAARELRSGRMSSVSVASGLCRLLLVEVLRVHLEEGRATCGALSALAHPRISKAIMRIHNDLSAPVRVDDLATEIGMSRSAFVERFTEVVGVGPKRYMMAQRMETASQLLRGTSLSMAEIGGRVGYDAPEAFSRAFKREMGCSPVDWRHLERSAA